MPRIRVNYENIAALPQEVVELGLTVHEVSQEVIAASSGCRTGRYLSDFTRNFATRQPLALVINEAVPDFSPYLGSANISLLNGQTAAHVAEWVDDFQMPRGPAWRLLSYARYEVDNPGAFLADSRNSLYGAPELSPKAGRLIVSALLRVPDSVRNNIEVVKNSPAFFDLQTTLPEEEAHSIHFTNTLEGEELKLIAAETDFLDEWVETTATRTLRAYA
jgi:hypothetical protein